MLPKISDFEIIVDAHHIEGRTGFFKNLRVFRSLDGSIEIPFYFISLQPLEKPKKGTPHTVVQLYDDLERVAANIRVQLCYSDAYDAIVKHAYMVKEK